MASFHTYFALTQGFVKPVYVRAWLPAELKEGITLVNEQTGLFSMGDLIGWAGKVSRALTAEASQELIDTVQRHNQLIKILYGWLNEGEQNRLKGDRDAILLSVEELNKIHPYLGEISIPPIAWKENTYRDQMEELYEILRGREDGVHMDEDEVLTPKQAANVIDLIGQWLEPDGCDLRLDVPDGHDYLASSDDGEYEWCGKCFKPIAEQDYCEYYSRGCAEHGRNCGMIDPDENDFIDEDEESAEFEEVAEEIVEFTESEDEE